MPLGPRPGVADREAEERQPAREGRDREREPDERHRRQLATHARRRAAPRGEPPPDAVVVAPRLRVGHGNEAVGERGPVRVRDDRGQAGADEERERPPRPERLRGGRAAEDRAVVARELVRVPRSGNEQRDDDRDRRRDPEATALARTGGGRDDEHGDDDAEGPERPGAHELREPEARAERDGGDEPVVGADEEPGGEDERARREQHRERLGMHHRRGLHHHRADGAEDDGRKVQDVATRPEEPQQHEQEHERPCGRQGVEDLGRRARGGRGRAGPRPRARHPPPRRTPAGCSSCPCPRGGGRARRAPRRSRAPPGRRSPAPPDRRSHCARRRARP